VTTPQNLPAWLKYIHALHTIPIAMGLDRVAKVAKKLELTPLFPMITVGGTNGKGSTCAMLERIYHEAGYRVGCYTSPHLLRYNERVRVGCSEVSDEDLCVAFGSVERARGEVALTYFEISTLAAVWHFMQSSLDVVILEVGLGGRLDAVNIFEPSCTIVTSIDIDHIDFLGSTRELIGFEKAGIYRKNKPAIIGDIAPPLSLLEHASRINADLRRIGQDFTCTKTTLSWGFKSNHTQLMHLPLPALVGEFQLNNAACAVEAIQCLQNELPVDSLAIAKGLQSVKLTGRFHKISIQPEVIVDVAHNPQAAAALAKNLNSSPCTGQTIAVFAMLADKDIHGVIDALVAEIDVWYIADTLTERGANSAMLNDAIHQVTIEKQYQQPQIKSFSNTSQAYKQACLDMSENDRIIVFGSFFTVADVLSF